MTAGKNQREFTRVRVAIHVELHMAGNVVIQGESQDVSLKGLLLRCETLVPEQTPCRVFLHLDGGLGGPIIEAQGLVSRTDHQNLAIQFTEVIGNESIDHLRNLVLYNSGTQACSVEEEFESHVGLHVKNLERSEK